ncbi:MAG: RluA family pseudouridine synthase [Lachnospiraceae bacterium]|nr:RluA family pseudouridine synthase [Lachnospiraceae bacterium]
MDECEVLTLEVGEGDGGLRIDKWIALALPSLSRSRAAKLIADGKISINEERVSKPSIVAEIGDEVRVELPNLSLPEILPEDIPIKVLYEDGDILVVDKPRGMVVHPAPGHYSGTLVNALLYHIKDLSGINGVLRPGIVHRIDRDTTGSLLVCKNDLAHRSIAEALKEHSIYRSYRAIVHGRIAEDGTVDAPICRSRKDRKKMAVSPDGKRAVTHYRVIENFRDFSYIECVLETGRTHQIRVHMSHIGHPVLGDTVYGSGKSPFATKGQMLHAMELGFKQPRTGVEIRVASPLPEDFQHILSSLM